MSLYDLILDSSYQKDHGLIFMSDLWEDTVLPGSHVTVKFWEVQRTSPTWKTDRTTLTHGPVSSDHNTILMERDETTITHGPVSSDHDTILMDSEESIISHGPASEHNTILMDCDEVYAVTKSNSPTKANATHSVLKTDWHHHQQPLDNKGNPLCFELRRQERAFNLSPFPPAVISGTPPTKPSWDWKEPNEPRTIAIQGSYFDASSFTVQLFTTFDAYDDSIRKNDKIANESSEISERADNKPPWYWLYDRFQAMSTCFD